MIRLAAFGNMLTIAAAGFFTAWFVDSGLTFQAYCAVVSLLLSILLTGIVAGLLASRSN